MADGRRSYLVAYDINDDVRRSRIAKILQSHGERLQYSVFLLRIRPSKILKIKALIEDEIDSATDSILVCDLGISDREKQAMLFIGRRGYHDTVIPSII
ncbi:CRISPR-associated endonuclease Cas2 [Bifidobacterium simiarum]|uniref:CRISPR-associated endonuclease Cas2 n=1 Tax=Bifidobacterium simiarum TaxID=2045441 RepID=UPI001BDBF337|nr:CRISPR-associated endonuclease Cas2 [Bifidobacterium simiarum]MBT1165778.1 CRISPR-associated endonuclease Cas2 [Bifidobacterium simiarum]